MDHCPSTDSLFSPHGQSASENPAAVCTRKGVFSPTRLAWGSAPVRTVTANVRFRYKGMAVMRAAIYARVSTKDGRQDTENQLRQLRRFAATQGWTVVQEYEDRASGKHGDRDQFRKMFAAASRREFNCLLFWSLDRLSREGTVETLNHLQRLTSYGVNYRSFTERHCEPGRPTAAPGPACTA
jgi:predicted site-specific integrase-resolvase